MFTTMPYKPYPTSHNLDWYNTISVLWETHSLVSYVIILQHIVSHHIWCFHFVHSSTTRLLAIPSVHTRLSTMIIFNYMMSSFIGQHLMVCSHMLLEHYTQTMCGVWETLFTYRTCVLSLMSLFQLLRSISGEATITVDLVRSRFLLRFCKPVINHSICGLGQGWYVQRSDVSKWWHKYQLDWKTIMYFYQQYSFFVKITDINKQKNKTCFNSTKFFQENYPQKAWSNKWTYWLAIAW